MSLSHNKPTLTTIQASKLLSEKGIGEAVSLIGIRGYFSPIGENLRGSYDDALFVCTPDYLTGYNGNTDPSGEHPGVAVLGLGVWIYRMGIHGLSKPKAKQYEALVQAGDVTVTRDQVAAKDTGRFGINIHRGSFNSTSSEGCQTIYPEQWPAFIFSVKSALAKYDQKTVPYLLLENDGSFT